MLRILELIFPPRSDEAALRDLSSDDLLTILSPLLIPATRPETTTLLPFSETRVRSAIHEAKYHGNTKAFELLALVLAEYLYDEMNIGKTIIVPIPLGKERRKERGFNQVEEIVRRALRNLDTEQYILETDLLKRVNETASQISLPREKREENMRGAFVATFPADPAHTYLLVDDVLTTGATLQAAIDALTKAGARHVIPLALAH